MKSRSIKPTSQAALLMLALLNVPAAAQTTVTAPAPVAAPAAAAATPAPAAPSAVTPAASGELQGFYNSLLNYPSLQQAQLAVDAAQQQLDAANFPISGTLSASTTANMNIDPAPDICATMPALQYTSLCADIPKSVQTLNASIRANLLNIGDVGARRDQARLNLDLARMGYRTALASVQAQAITAAQRAYLADNSLKLAQKAVDTATLTLQVVQNRVQGGGATPIEARQAELTLAQAQSNLQAAQENAKLAHDTLQDLTGNPNPPAAVLSLSVPVPGKSAGVQQAEIAVARAQIVAKQTTWNAYPTAQASYMHFTNGDTNTLGLGASIDSKTLAPALNISYAPKSVPTYRVHDQLTLAVNLNASADTFAGPAVARNQVVQAQAALAAAQRQADLQQSGLTTAYTQAQRQLALSQQALEIAQQQQKDAEARRDIGLISPLEAAQTTLAAYQAQMNINQAQIALTDAAGKFYSFFAMPLVAPMPTQPVSTQPVHP